MILTVTGWRYWRDDVFVRQHFSRLLNFYDNDLDIRVGDAAGVDEIIRNMCSRLWLLHTVYRADWENLGQAAGPIRNGQMLRGENNPHDPHPGVLADKLLAFPQPGVKMRSPGSGTVGCLTDAHLLGIDVEIPGYKSRGE